MSCNAPKVMAKLRTITYCCLRLSCGLQVINHKRLWNLLPVFQSPNQVKNTTKPFCSLVLPLWRLRRELCKIYRGSIFHEGLPELRFLRWGWKPQMKGLQSWNAWGKRLPWHKNQKERFTCYGKWYLWDPICMSLTHKPPAAPILHITSPKKLKEKSFMVWCYNKWFGHGEMLWFFIVRDVLIHTKESVSC